MMMDISQLSDAELLSRVTAGDAAAEEALAERYSRLVRICARPLFLAGGDSEDLIQEGMFGLLSAIRQYDPEKEASFATFAGVCITRQIISAIRMADREKHKVLNTSVSLSKPVGGEEEDVTLADTLMVSGGESPEALLVVKDLAYYIMHNEGNVFSEFEMQVLNEMVRDNDYEKIARRLKRSSKSVDNAMQRIKKKVIRYLWG